MSRAAPRFVKLPRIWGFPVKNYPKEPFRVDFCRCAAGTPMRGHSAESGHRIWAGFTNRRSLAKSKPGK